MSKNWYTVNNSFPAIEMQYSETLSKSSKCQGMALLPKGHVVRRYRSLGFSLRIYIDQPVYQFSRARDINVFVCKSYDPRDHYSDREGHEHTARVPKLT